MSRQGLHKFDLMIVHNFTELLSSRHDDDRLASPDDLQGGRPSMTNDQIGLFDQLLKGFARDEGPVLAMTRRKPCRVTDLHEYRKLAECPESGKAIHRFQQTSKPLRGTPDRYEDHRSTPP